MGMNPGFQQESRSVLLDVDHSDRADKPRGYLRQCVFLKMHNHDPHAPTKGVQGRLIPSQVRLVTPYIRVGERQLKGLETQASSS